MSHTAYHCDTALLTHRSSFGSKLIFKSINYLSLMMSVARERQQLRGLSADALKDMGLQQGAVQRETARPFWDLPKERTL